MLIPRGSLGSVRCPRESWLDGQTRSIVAEEKGWGEVGTTLMSIRGLSSSLGSVVDQVWVE